MKHKLFNALMFAVGCFLWCITGAVFVLGMFGVAWLLSIAEETGNWNMLWWLCATPVIVAIEILLFRFTSVFWCEYK